MNFVEFINLMFFVYSLPLHIKMFFQNVLSLLLEVRITGEDFLKDFKQGIIVSNHYDISDLIIPLFFIPKPIYLIYPLDIKKDNTFDLLLNQNLKIFYNLLEIQFVEKENLYNTILGLSKNHFIFIYPELKPTTSGVIQPFNEDMVEAIYRSALQNNLPIFPSGIQGTYKLSDIFSMVQLAFQRIKINYNIGNPIFIESNVDEIALKNDLEKQVYALSLHPERRKRSRAIIRTDAREL